MAFRPIYDLLYIEDRPYDVEVVRAVLKDRNHRLRLNNIPSPLEAIQYIHRQEKYADAPLADLVILDLHANPQDGFHFLRERSDHPFWRIAPIIVLVRDDDVAYESYELGANACIQKPEGLEALASTVTEIEAFWFRTATLPPPEWQLRDLIRARQ
jgi:two-component system, chemotaxis family, response regulator Rcp1